MPPEVSLLILNRFLGFSGRRREGLRSSIQPFHSVPLRPQIRVSVVAAVQAGITHLRDVIMIVVVVGCMVPFTFAAVITAWEIYRMRHALV